MIDHARDKTFPDFRTEHKQQYEMGKRKQKLGGAPSVTPEFRGTIIRVVARTPEESLTASALICTFKPKLGVPKVQFLT